MAVDPEVDGLVEACRAMLARVPQRNREGFFQMVKVHFEAWDFGRERDDIWQRRLFAEPTTTPEETLREAGISDKRQARYQRRMSSLLAGRQIRRPVPSRASTP